MPAYLPVDLLQYIDQSSTYVSIRNLTLAAERGDIPLSSVASYIRACDRGDEIRYSKTRRVPTALLEMIDRRRDLLPRQVVYMGWNDGLWDLEDVEAWENNQTVLSEARAPVRRGVYLTRNRRVSRRHQRTEGRFVPKMSLDALCRFGICDGAKACLALLMSIAGKESTIVTYTSSIATELGRTTRTVRNHFIALEAAGLITRTPGREPNTVRITISPECRPEAYREADEVRAFRLASRSSNKILRMMAFSVSAAAMGAYPSEFRPDEGRKEISPFNPESNHLPCILAEPGTSERRPMRRNVGPTTHSNLIREMKPSPISSLRNSTGRIITKSLGTSDWSAPQPAAGHAGWPLYRAKPFARTE